MAKALTKVFALSTVSGWTDSSTEHRLVAVTADKETADAWVTADPRMNSYEEVAVVSSVDQARSL